ncbi:MAG: N-acetylneuraminate synthase family protein [Treponema sp.]
MIIAAEIGTAHGGSLQKAYSLIDEAKDSGADAVKFQWVYADEILHPDTGFVNLPGGKVRLYDRFKALEVEPSFFKSCLEYSHKKGLKFFCSPFGIKSLEELVEIHPDGIKIASPEVNHFPMLKEISSSAKNIPVIISSGVSKLGDLEKALDVLSNIKDITLLHCITFYPAPEDEYNVLCVKTLHDIFGVATGISDHSLDPVLVPVLTTAFGGEMIEKHITLSKKTDGLDDPVALEGEQFSQMVHAVHQTEALLGRYKKEELASCSQLGFTNSCSKKKDLVLTAAQNEIIKQLSSEYGKEKVFAVLGSGVKKLAKIEIQNYGRTNRSLHYMKEMKKGDVVSSKDISVLRTEKVLTTGISPEYYGAVLGSVLQKDVESGSGVQLEDFIQRSQQCT